jgi:hypothetical protein
VIKLKYVQGLKKPITNLAGVEIKSDDGSVVTVGSIISNMLATSQSKEPIRMINLATKIYSGVDEMEVEDADFESVKQQIESATIWTNLVKASCLNVWKDQPKAS